MDKVRLAIVGCGTVSQLNVPGYLQHDKCEIVALCDPNRERAERRARQWGIDPKIHVSYQDVLNDSEIDAVELLTPTFLHTEQIASGLEAGRHVSCQKPISNTIAEADQIIAAVSKAKARFRVTENFLFYPPLMKAKELLDTGAIGEPSMVRIRTTRGQRITGSGLGVEPEAYIWRSKAGTNAGGQIFDDGWHKYATAMWWIGDVEKVNSIIVMTDNFIIESPSAITWKFRDTNCLGIMEYRNADQMPIRSKYYPADEFFEIQGSKGVIWVTRCTGEMLDMPPVMLVKGTGTTSYDVPMDWIEGFNGSARNFIDCILRDEQPDMDVHFSKKVLQAILATYKANETERVVDPVTMT